MARTPKVVDDRREQIIDAAVRVFAEKGFDKATNKDIASEAGITAGLIYHYFKNKEELLKAALDANSPEQLLRTLPKAADLPPEKMLRFVAEQLLTAAESDRFVQLIRIYLPEMIHNPGVAPLGLPMIHDVVEFLAAYLTQKMESGELRSTDARLTAQVFLGSMMDLVLMRQIAHDPIVLQYSRKQIVDHLVQTTLYGLAPR